MSNNSVSLHRVVRAKPEKVFRAFTDANAFLSWLAPYGMFAEIEEMEMKVGGKYKMSFTNFSTGKKQSFGGEYLGIEPDKFIKYIDRFDDPNLPGDMITSISFTPVSVGTELKITQENIPAAIPLDACYLGWQESLEKLKKLVEPEIPEEF